MAARRTAAGDPADEALLAALSAGIGWLNPAPPSNPPGCSHRRPAAGSDRTGRICPPSATPSRRPAGGCRCPIPSDASGFTHRDEYATPAAGLVRRAHPTEAAGGDDRRRVQHPADWMQWRRHTGDRDDYAHNRRRRADLHFTTPAVIQQRHRVRRRSAVGTPPPTISPKMFGRM